MYHCSGGEGPSEIDLLTPVMHWVEAKEAPGEIMVRQEDENESTTLATRDKTNKHGKPAQAAEGRPVYPYPYTARFIGRGSSSNSGHYKRGAPLTNAPTPAWRGSDFYTPYEPRDL